ncbi:MAG: diguanylate cyclase, partial [Lachnospiraceae bacterium]|nr:diguanylate cyclase [Lachnospiraceae bacterium]
METLFDYLIDRIKNEKNMDYLTGMVNRRGLHEIWETLPEGACVHCLYMDVDNFKLVNDVYG